MAATMSPMAILNTKTIITKSSKTPFLTKQIPSKPISQFSIQNNLVPNRTKSPSVTETAIAGAAFASLSATEPALAAAEGTTEGLVVSGSRLMEQIGLIGDAAAVAVASTPSTDNRGTLLLLVISPAILWVLYNILQPALNQLNRMRSK